ncbi:MAG: hypothetical protein P8Q85_02885 [Candidatus Poseidoniaceae archaeon]|nr:hypothetical protein [Candidatus Poseidoniaceae archaeon]
MAGGGTAPSMKMSDVFLLVGMSILVGGIIMHIWTASTALDEASPTLESGASMLKEDTLTFELSPGKNASITIIVLSEDGATVAQESWSPSEGEDFEYTFTAKEGGFYTYTVTYESGEGEAFVDVNRNTMIDFIAYPIGAACLAFGVYKRTLESDEVLDAELEG